MDRMLASPPRKIYYNTRERWVIKKIGIIEGRGGPVGGHGAKGETGQEKPSSRFLCKRSSQPFKQLLFPLPALTDHYIIHMGHIAALLKETD